MKLIPPALLLCLLTSCIHHDGPAINNNLADQIISNYSKASRRLIAAQNLLFWKLRMEQHPENFVNGPKYASALLGDFQVRGNIYALKEADSLLRESNRANQGKEPGILRSLASLCLMQHRFHAADSMVKAAILIEGRTISNLLLQFDVAYELGDYETAQRTLQSVKEGKTYGYLFRKAKWEHLEGTLDQAIHFMKAASNKAVNNKWLAQTAATNEADLYVHKGSLAKAATLFTDAVQNDPADWHSILGLGWIALVKDGDTAIAGKLFRLVAENYEGPEPLLHLAQLAEAKNNNVEALNWYRLFWQKASLPVYGNMYSRYLIDLYGNRLNRPGLAVSLAKNEINNRPTAQVFAWYAWSLLQNNKPDDALKVYKSYVSGRPLEGPELYFMYKLMEATQRNFDASQYRNAAWQNRYDLSPQRISELREQSRN